MCSDNRASATAEKPKPLLFVAFKLLPSHARASPRVTLAVFSLPFPFYNVNNSYNFFSLFNNKQLTRRRRNFSALGFIHLFSEENPLLSPKHTCARGRIEHGNLLCAYLCCFTSPH
ncbi:hypothetical protein GLYMA_08G039751v4 [Glycine max]|nr:hypothetical protein GLYMA_08G039751v4 [Glycine max]KAH1049537.1 hypothetical protein GYH30_020179 [Glycine max]